MIMTFDRHKTLDKLRSGDKAVVTAVSSSNTFLQKKLLTMGLIAGTSIEVLCHAPLGDPIKIKALGCMLSLRLSEAASIEVQSGNRN